MAVCIKCYNSYPDKRLSLGYRTCIVCGDKEANKEVIRKSTCIAPLFNKGAYQYIGDVSNAKYIGR
tara:strand:+ start:963 stop:1160 length:198 start_codon:yes stop_codon:yes gene_type:complete